MLSKIVVPPNHAILIGVSIINHPFWEFPPYFWVDTHISSNLPEWIPRVLDLQIRVLDLQIRVERKGYRPVSWNAATWFVTGYTKGMFKLAVG